MKIYSRYECPAVQGCTFVKPSLTSQEFKDEVDINNVLKKYAAQAKLLGLPISEVLPPLSSDQFSDVSNYDDFISSMNKIATMKQTFENLPSDVRRKYGDRVEDFVKGLSNPDDFNYLAEKGVLNKDEVKHFMDVYKNVHNSSVDATEKVVEKQENNNSAQSAT